jgi:hypothetical protein
MAWAQRNRVELNASTRRELTAAAERSQIKTASRSCCHHKTDAASCCSVEHDEPSTLLAISAAKCRGVDSHWTLISPLTLPLDAFSDEVPAISDAVVESRVLFVPVEAEPPVPPPRLGAV